MSELFRGTPRAFLGGLQKTNYSSLCFTDSKGVDYEISGISEEYGVRLTPHLAPFGKTA